MTGKATTPWVDGFTIGAVLRRTAEKFPDQDACVFCEPAVRCTWRELDQQVDAVARGLIGLGFERGDHFGIWATNVPEWVLLQFATARAGIVLVTINPGYRPAELSYTLRQADIKGIALIDRFRTSRYVDMLQEACPEIEYASNQVIDSTSFPKLRRVVQIRGAQQPGMLSWAELLNAGSSVSDDMLAARESTLRPSDPVNIQYTSGTTGNPKGATLSHQNVLMNAYYAGECQRFTERDRVGLPVPLYHCFGCVLGTLCCLIHGTAMIFPSEGFKPRETLRAIEAEQVTSIYGVPTMFIAQLEHTDFENFDLSSLRTGIMAGSSCPAELMKRVMNDMGAAEITIGYGQTEASPLITQTRPDDSIELRTETVGRVLPGFEARIVDAETGNVLGDNQEGEFCGRGHGIMIGYYNMPDRTAEAIDADGWLHTGDLAVRMPNGYYRITGRLTDMIIRGGENIYPREIEERLYQHPAVEDVQVVGVPDHRFGEQVLACVKLRPQTPATKEDLSVFCAESLAHFKVPRYWQFVDEFPVTVTGRIQKLRLREMAVRELGLES